jgi:hypothetical protein
MDSSELYAQIYQSQLVADVHLEEQPLVEAMSVA